MSGKSSKSNNSKKKTGGNLKLALTVIAIFFLLIVLNSCFNFSSSLPTFKDLKGAFSEYMSSDVDLSDYESDNPFKKWANENKSKNNDNVVLDGDCSVHYIDVGQGNCTLICCDGHYMLIDAGENDKGNLILNYLTDLGITKLDYVVASHPHSDHIGGLDVVINSIETENIIMPELKDSIIPTSITYEDLLVAIDTNNVKVIKAVVGKTYSLGGGYFVVLGPSGDFNDLNNMSVAIKFVYGDTSFLSTADMETSAEKVLITYNIDLSADVFLMGHHGSNTSNSENFLNLINAKYYVIQSGIGNKYGHPNVETLQKVAKLNGKLYRCDESGTVIFYSDGKNLTVKTSK